MVKGNYGSIKRLLLVIVRLLVPLLYGTDAAKHYWMFLIFLLSFIFPPPYFKTTGGKRNDRWSSHDK